MTANAMWMSCGPGRGAALHLRRHAPTLHGCETPGKGPAAPSACYPAPCDCGPATPSHLHTARSTETSSAALTWPMRRTRRGNGTVTRPCASNPPDFKNPRFVFTSNLQSRRLVVCGTRVTKARSVSLGGTLSTRAGRILAARPSSTIQTSPLAGGLNGPSSRAGPVPGTPDQRPRAAHHRSGPRARP